MKAAKEMVMEVTTFTLKETIDETAFLKSVEEMQNSFLSGQKGFLGRSLACAEDGVWKDVILWQDRGDMEEAVAKARQNEAAGPFMASIDPASVEMEVLILKARYG